MAAQHPGGENKRCAPRGSVSPEGSFESASEARKEGERMATKKQIAANRKNAKRSTGPRTGAGKARSSMNSTRHGLLGKFHLIQDEDPQEFSKFEEGARAILKPEGEVEEYYVNRWIESAWRLNRLDNVISELLVKEESLADLSIEDVMNLIESMEPLSTRSFYQISEIEKRLNEPKAHSYGETQATAHDVAELSRRAEVEFLQTIFLKHLIHRLSKMSSVPNKAWSAETPAETDRAGGERDAPSTEDAINAIARAFSRNPAAVALALRYRAKIERSLDNALHELQRLQAARKGQLVAAPEVVDVNVNSTGKEEKEKD